MLSFPQKAVERFEILQTLIGLDVELKNAEPETYAGLYIRHSPGFRIITLFTSNGEEIVRSYVPDDLFEYVEVQPVSISYFGLLQSQTRITDTLNNMGVDTESHIDVRENRVVVNVMDLNRIDAAIQENELEIPDYVEIIKVGKFGIPKNASA
ncbi:MAG: hypothetical protein A2158_03775 [Chloroflexi bacterium RBG_13_46_14]|nr:MAG: hypothetical protein A2158_03775 [Chloroflexi bacterium RBG_13_46_14]